MAKYRVGKKTFHVWKMADMHQQMSTYVQLQWLYTAFTSPFDNLLKLICSRLPKMLSTPITIDGKPTPHMENPTHIRKMQLIAPLTVLV